jgi:hypothetical protein
MRGTQSSGSQVTHKVYLEIDDARFGQENMLLPTVRFLNDLLEIQNCDLAIVCLYKKTHCPASYVLCQSKWHLKYFPSHLLWRALE